MQVLQKFDAVKFFSPKATDVPYTQTNFLKISLILRLDSYKFGHPFAYRPGIEAMTSYGTARLDGSKQIVPFGAQILLKSRLDDRLTKKDVDDAEAFSEAHFGRKLFARSCWDKVVEQYKGRIPLIIRAVREGTIIRGGQPIYTVTVLDKDLYWMSAAFETLIQRGFWYPTTIATLDYNIKQKIKSYYEMTGANMAMLVFALHDFGGRGVTCGEQAEIGGAAHTVNFMGSDTVEGILAANHYYKEKMSAFSVYATEHAVECSWGGGSEDAVAYIRHQLKMAKSLGLQIISIVIDGYDVYREAKMICTVLRDEIIASGIKVVFRPDSGDMMEVVPRILKMQEDAFGVELTDRGFKRIKYVGVIQGDGVDHLSIQSLLDKVTGVLRYSADVVIFGSGGALLQKVNRDTLKFAQKATAILVNGEWVGTSKNPITDPGKKSLEGVLTTCRNLATGETVTVRVDQTGIPEGHEDLMDLVYHYGDLYNETTLAEVRARVELG